MLSDDDRLAETYRRAERMALKKRHVEKIRQRILNDGWDEPTANAITSELKLKYDLPSLAWAPVFWRAMNIGCLMFAAGFLIILLASGRTMKGMGGLVSMIGFLLEVFGMFGHVLISKTFGRS